MNKLQIKLERLELMLVEDGYNKSNIALQTLIDAQKEAINYTYCCKSDSELLVCDNCDGDGGRNFTEGFLPCPKCKGSGVAN